MAVMTNIELAEKCIDIVKNYKTLYVMGCFGAPMTEKNKIRYINHHSYNQKSARVEMIQNADENTFGFDCVCLIKAILWGWNGDKNHVYGGSKYKSNDIPDIGANSIIKVCTGISTDFSLPNIEIGELVWMDGHVGIYIGNGLVVECSPAWENKVQITACNQSISGYNRRNWTKHGKLPYIEYIKSEIKEEVKKEATANIAMTILTKGKTGSQVKTLQRLLLSLGYNMNGYGVDGSFGPATETAVKNFQKANGLVVDGSVGPATWNKILKDC